ncbi:MAG: MMPL family transporter, partial [Acidimicrobiales bacterium]
SKVGVQNETAFLPASSPSQQADRLIHRLFPKDPTLDASILVFSRGRPLTSADHRYIAALTARIPAQVPQVRTVQSAEAEPALASELISPDSKAELVIVSMRPAPFTSASNDAVVALRKVIRQGAPPGLEANATGAAPLAADQANGILGSFSRTALLSGLLVILALLLVYRSLVAALVPLVSIGVAYAVAQGIVAIMAQHGFKVASLAGTFMVVMIFGAGTDYCLFVVSRYRSELKGGHQPGPALRRTMTVMGAVLASSAVTVIIGFMSQLTAKFGMYKTMGPAIGVGIAVTLAAGLTLTPGLLSLLGRYAFWPSTIERVTSREEKPSHLWEAVGAKVAARPRSLAALFAGLLGLCALGMVDLHQSFDLLAQLPSSADARVGYDAISRHFPPGAAAPAYVVIDAGAPILAGNRLEAVDRLTDAIRKMPGVAQVRSVTQPFGEPITLANLGQLRRSGGAAGLLAQAGPGALHSLGAAINSPRGLRLTGPVLRANPGLVGQLGTFLGTDGDSTRLVVSVSSEPYSASGLNAIERLAPYTAHYLSGGPLAGARLAVGGPSTFFADMRSLSARDFRVIIAVLTAAVFVVLALLLRCLMAPFYLLATVGLSYVATMGLLSGVFDPLTGQGGVTFFVPPFLFVILVALGADYNIFIMSRVAEERAAGWSVAEAARRGLVLTGSVISSAGLILAGTFAALMLAPLPALRQMGFAVTAGVLIDTFVVRSVLVPALTISLGRWAFWPLGFELSRRQRVRQYGVALSGVLALGSGLIGLVLLGRTLRPPGTIPGRFDGPGTSVLARAGLAPGPDLRVLAARAAAHPDSGPLALAAFFPPTLHDSSAGGTPGAPGSGPPGQPAPGPGGMSVSVPIGLPGMAPTSTGASAGAGGAGVNTRVGTSQDSTSASVGISSTTTTGPPKSGAGG